MKRYRKVKEEILVDCVKEEMEEKRVNDKMTDDRATEASGKKMVTIYPYSITCGCTSSRAFKKP